VSFNTTRSAQPRSSEERERILAAPGFGLHFTDHMVEVRWDKDTGWHDAVVRPYGPLQLDPAAAVLHYGQEIFEGIKAYRHADGSIWTFRPEANGRRLQRSAQRLALPELPVEIFVESLKQLIAVDASWVPSADESSLYFRPFMIGDEAFLGVRGAHKAGYYVIASPAGPYFAKGVAPVAIWQLFQIRGPGRLDLGFRLYPRGARGHRRGQVRWQLRRLAAAAAEGAGTGLLAGAVPGPGRGQVPGRTGRHERVPGLQGRHLGDPGAVGQHPGRHHP